MSAADWPKSIYLGPSTKRAANGPKSTYFPFDQNSSIGLIKAPKNRKIPAACRFENRPKRISVLPVLPGLPLWTTCELSQSRVTNTLGRTVIAHHTVKLKAIQIVFFTRPCLDTLKIRIFFTHAWNSTLEIRIFFTHAWNSTLKIRIFFQV
jgi:hypothetical protein